MGFGNKCKHSFNITDRKFTPPVAGLKKLRGLSVEEASDILFGFTTIKQVCSVCGLTDFIVVKGDQR